ncbi:MAG TPA: hypothetical protein VIH72_11805 [Candidatus Acidoferrales bacterium]
MKPKKWLPLDRRVGVSSGSGPEDSTGWWGAALSTPNQVQITGITPRAR